MGVVDFSTCKIGFRGYNGADKKIPRIYNGKQYMVKFPSKVKESQENELIASYFNNPISEYIGCHIFQSVGIEAQNTLLGHYEQKIVVGCEDFLTNPENAGYELQEFGMFQNSYFESNEIGKNPNLEQVNELFSHHERLQYIERAAREKFWDTFIIDALIANFDRHAGNWGYLVHPENGHIKLAPVYDCGATLFARLDDESLKDILNNKEEIEKRTFGFPLSAIQYKGHKIDYKEYISSLDDAHCNAALLRIVPKINMGKIIEIIDGIEIISDTRKEFYGTILQSRYEKILNVNYERAAESMKKGLVYCKQTENRGHSNYSDSSKDTDIDR